MLSDVAIPDTFATTAQPSACHSEYCPHRRARASSAALSVASSWNSSWTATPSGSHEVGPANGRRSDPGRHTHRGRRARSIHRSAGDTGASVGRQPAERADGDVEFGEGGAVDAGAENVDDAGGLGRERFGRRANTLSFSNGTGGFTRSPGVNFGFRASDNSEITIDAIPSLVSVASTAPVGTSTSSPRLPHRADC